MEPWAFPATRWTLVWAAGLDNREASGRALSELCTAYWYPVYAFIRRTGRSPDEARDLTQEFFLRFLEKRYFTSADPEKGRFRSFLLTSVKRFLGDQADHDNAAKRGGKLARIDIDAEDGERRYLREFIDYDTPEKVFEREWARTLMSRVLDVLRQGLEREGRANEFNHLRQFLPGHDGPEPYANVASQLGTTEVALKVAIHRLRRRYRDYFHAEIAQLVTDPSQIAGEVQHLLNTLQA